MYYSTCATRTGAMEESVMVGMGVGERFSQYETSCLASYSRIAWRKWSAQKTVHQDEQNCAPLGRRAKAEVRAEGSPAQPITQLPATEMLTFGRHAGKMIFKYCSGLSD